MVKVQSGVRVADISGCIDGCRYMCTLVLVWPMLVVILMVKVHPSLGAAHVKY